MGKRKHRKKHSSSSDSEADSARSSDDRKSRKEKKRKSNGESSEDRRRRKEEKRKRKEELSTTIALMGYSEADNPFGDANLGQKFVWHKKKEREKKKGVTDEEQRHKEMTNKEITQAELDKLQRRRKEREAELQLREEEKLRMQREADRAALGDWEAREDEFHLEQAKRRAEIRIKEGRAKPIDVLAINMQLAENPEMLDQGFEVDTDEPYLLFEELSLPDVQELHKDIQMYLALEKNPDTVQFWEALLVVADSYLSKLTSDSSATESGVSEAVHQDIDNMLSDKTYDQLSVLQEQITNKLKSGGPVDVEYWETLLKALTVWKAKARLRAMHQEMLRTRLEQLRLKREREHEEAVEKGKDKADEGEEAERTKKVISLKDAWKRRDEEKSDAVNDETLYQHEMRKGFEEDEEIFQEEMALASKNYNWSDKYRPRKPRYFNRVHTGFEWNKYNQTHYDPDNPPPKVVQGYKFNIFYPDLIDKTKAPTYKIIKDPNDPDTVIIKFIAGPPYEDVAFRIVNKEWEMSHRKGFKCVFDRGVLQLHLNFKRFWYRR